jgi:histidine phosphotransferase ChpT
VNNKSEALRLVELASARLCHDLAGPIGTLLGALEVLREDVPDNEEATLAEEAAIDLAERLKLLRAAWGRSVEELDASRLKATVAGLADKRKVRVELDALGSDLVFAAHAARIILNSVLLGLESLPGGGTLALSGNTNGSVLLTIAGARAAWPAGLASWLVDENAAWEAIGSGERNFQGALTALLVRDYGFRLSMLMSGRAGGGDVAPPILLEFASG